jgi:hypothetical protein
MYIKIANCPSDGIQRISVEYVCNLDRRGLPRHEPRDDHQHEAQRIVANGRARGLGGCWTHRGLFFLPLPLPRENFLQNVATSVATEAFW